MKKKLLLMILGIICCGIGSSLKAQRLSDLPKAEREVRLLKIAKEVYQRDRFKAFYREYGEPFITEFVYPYDNDNPKSISYGARKGDIMYKVHFPYDQTKEVMEAEYAAVVTIYDKTGEVIDIFLGNNIGIILKRIKEKEK
ncbi:hypothetical protein HQ47_07265 [Porphyromonas macacae]|uniref:Uncharacterized protein n=1 Tax=Porphyromonas macacae TaxID=28115 RepID=A0A0A2E495_9PORP|nr:hypothetical protein [Porphyromonas macacae]KGN73733.1 hypothetical protein HQ47_07265 [Porphyromonas macacae]SUB88157.1 Uncharacterised protein [Porphyromonas macacae]